MTELLYNLLTGIPALSCYGVGSVVLLCSWWQSWRPSSSLHQGKWRRKRLTAEQIQAIIDDPNKAAYSLGLKRGEYVMVPETFQFSEWWEAGRKQRYQALCRHDLFTSTLHYHIPQALPSDGASIPWWIRPLVLLFDPWARFEAAARWHDSAFQMGFVEHLEANFDFAQLMDIFGVPPVARALCFLGVRFGSGPAWRRCREDEGIVRTRLAESEMKPDLSLYLRLEKQIGRWRDDFGGQLA